METTEDLLVGVLNEDGKVIKLEDLEDEDLIDMAEEAGIEVVEGVTSRDHLIAAIREHAMANTPAAGGDEDLTAGEEVSIAVGALRVDTEVEVAPTMVNGVYVGEVATPEPPHLGVRIASAFSNQRQIDVMLELYDRLCAAEARLAAGE